MGTRDKVAIEWKGGAVLAVHKIRKGGPGEPGFYRDTTSIEAFRNRELNRIHKGGDPIRVPDRFDCTSCGVLDARLERLERAYRQSQGAVRQ